MVPLFYWTHPSDPAVALLLKKPQSLTNTQHKLVAVIFIATQQSISNAWRTPTVYLHKVKVWMLAFLINAKITALLDDKV